MDALKDVASEPCSLVDTSSLVKEVDVRFTKRASAKASLCMAEVTVAAWVSANAAFSIIAPAPNKVVAAKTPLKILVVRLSLSFNGR